MATLDSRKRHRFSARTPGHAVPTRAYQPRHHASTTAAAFPPPKQEGPLTRASKACRLDKPHSISAVGPEQVGSVDGRLVAEG